MTYSPPPQPPLLTSSQLLLNLVRSLVLAAIGGATPIVIGTTLLSMLEANHSSGASGLVIATAVVAALSLISLVGLARRRLSPWFAIPCTLVGAMLALLGIACYGITRIVH